MNYIFAKPTPLEKGPDWLTVLLCDFYPKRLVQPKIKKLKLNYVYLEWVTSLGYGIFSVIDLVDREGDLLVTKPGKGIVGFRYFYFNYVEDWDFLLGLIQELINEKGDGDGLDWLGIGP